MNYWRAFFFFSYTLAFLQLCSLVPEAHAESSPPKLNPQICIGYAESNPSYILRGEEVPTGKKNRYHVCPEGHAFYGVLPPVGANAEAPLIEFNAACCPLPAPDILESEHTLTTTKCPDGYVATGQPLDDLNRDTEEYMRCTKINTKRYQLGPPTSGAAWGVSSVGLYFWKEQRRMKRKEIPAAIRFGLSRYSNGNLCRTDVLALLLGVCLLKNAQSVARAFPFANCNL